MTGLRVRDLGLSFSGLAVLKQITLEVRAETIHAIIGPNGAGKTSLINCISGFYRPQFGDVWIGDQRTTGMPAHAIAQLGVARVFQNIELFRHLTVLDNILLGRHLSLRYPLSAAGIFVGQARRAETVARRKAEEILEFVELEAYRRTIVGTLSHGLQKKVELARALAMEPRLLLLDEPTSGMNREEKEDMVRFILGIRRKFGPTLVLVDHDMRVVMEISDRVTVLNFGTNIAEGSPDEVQQSPAVIEAYLGSSHSAGDVRGVPSP